jgi:septum formation protein
LGLTGWIFDIQPADVDENPLNGEAPQDYVLRLAEAKGRAAAGETRQKAIIIAADTTVADGEDILGKPVDGQEALTMLKNLRGRTHQVFTALAVYDKKNDHMETDLAATDVPMRDYTDEEIQAYIETEDPFDKAGSYAIQHPGFNPVKALSGCYANVVGLPLCHLERTLVKFGVRPTADVQTACQQTLGYDCKVYPSVLKGNL